MRNREILLAPLALTWVLGLGACTKPPAEETLSLPAGSPVAIFDPNQITELGFSKNAEGDAWSARLARTPQGWVISSSPNGKPLPDRLADSVFLDHLSSTFRSFQSQGEAPHGPLANFGLDPARFVLQWKLPDRAIEVRIGDELKDGAGVYAFLPGPPPSAVFVANGAAVQMLELVTSFDVLRKRALLTWTSDDVDSIQLSRGNHEILFAQREGNAWGDRKDKKISKPDVAAIVDGLTHLRIKKFIDDLPEVTEHSVQPELRAILRNIHGEAQELRIQVTGSDFPHASVSSRSGAVFEVFREAIGFWRLDH